MKFLGGLVWLFLSSCVCAETAYEWGSVLTLESVSTIEGGVETGNRQLGNLDITLDIDTHNAGWWESGHWFLYVLGDYGKDPSELTGDWQGVSNIAADDAIKIYEFWYEHRFMDDAFKVLLGLHDYNSTFYSLESAGLFSHPSFGIGPDTSQVGPSIFPTTAMTLHLTVEHDHFYGLLAVYDGVPGNPENPRGTHIRFDEGDGTFLATEVGMAVESSYKIGLGGWRHTADVESPVSAEMIHSNTGVYLVGEKWWTADTAVFMQVGYADEQVNQVGNYYGAGVVTSNVLKDEDNLGVAVASAHNGDSYREYYPEFESAETAWEFSYLLPVNEVVSLQSSVYYIQNPSMDKTIDDALAIGLRGYIEF